MYWQNTVFLGFIGPNTIPKIIQNMSKMWDEVYNNRVIAVVHGLIVAWPTHCRGGPSLRQWVGHATINPWTTAITLNYCSIDSCKWGFQFIYIVHVLVRVCILVWGLWDMMSASFWWFVTGEAMKINVRYMHLLESRL